MGCGASTNKNESDDAHLKRVSDERMQNVVPSPEASGRATVGSTQKSAANDLQPTVRDGGPPNSEVAPVTIRIKQPKKVPLESPRSKRATGKKESFLTQLQSGGNVPKSGAPAGSVIQSETMLMDEDKRDAKLGRMRRTLPQGNMWNTTMFENEEQAGANKSRRCSNEEQMETFCFGAQNDDDEGEKSSLLTPPMTPDGFKISYSTRKNMALAVVGCRAQVDACAEVVGLNKLTLVTVVTAFAGCMTSNSVKEEQFIEVLKGLRLFEGQDDSTIRSFYSALDHEGVGSVGAEELTMAMAVFTQDSRMDKLAVCFNMYDADQKGIKKGELQKLYQVEVIGALKAVQSAMEFQIPGVAGGLVQESGDVAAVVMDATPEALFNSMEGAVMAEELTARTFHHAKKDVEVEAVTHKDLVAYLKSDREMFNNWFEAVKQWEHGY